MSKYINALNALGDCKFCKNRETCTERRGKHTFCWEIDERFTVDVVEVVRCEDCIYGIENGELCGRKVYLCSSMTNPNEFYGDFYCAGGKRKESDS